MNIRSPAKLWIGGWYNNYTFVGDLDEVRISKVARSANWVRLEYENQKPMQTLVGPLVSKGNAFSVSKPEFTLLERESATVSAEAGGALKVYWVMKHDAAEAVVAVDQYSYTIDAGRVTGDRAMTLQFKAIYANEVKIKEIPVVVKKNIPDPVFTLRSPSTWNGRDAIEVVPVISNLEDMKTHAAGEAKTGR